MRLFSTEAVSKYHPDKYADQISDAILTECLKQDRQSHCGIETMVKGNTVVLGGEITSKADINYDQIVRRVAKKLGYRADKIINLISEQSPEINRAVLSDEDIGAGDQGMMFGYATDETPEYMPYPISLAHKLTRQLTKVRKDGTLSYLRPDGKSQVSVEYDENGKPFRLEAVVLSTQHDEHVSQEQIHEDIKKYVFDPILPTDMIDADTKFFINPTGRFVIGGPNGDSGLTGRKIIVDTYGGYARHGGGAFSGKDCTKVDRSAAYAARYVAKNIVAAGLAKRCTISLAYAIGKAQPVAVTVDTEHTGIYSDDVLEQAVRTVFNLTPDGMIGTLGLDQPMFQKFCNYGHFTHADAPWERTDMTEVLECACRAKDMGVSHR